MKQWLGILERAVATGVRRPDRTGVGTVALFGEQLVFDNTLESFPAVTAKHLAFGQVKAELCAFLRGYETLQEFHSVGCHIWDGNANSDYWKPHARREGDLGRIYGVQWRQWRSCANDNGPGENDRVTGHREIDQIAALLEGMRKDPYGRRHLVTALNPGEAEDMCLPPCHVLFQAFVSGGQLDLRVDMRSVDLFLGLPFDIASYALLQRLLAQDLGLRSRKLVFQLGDAHVYLNHLEQVKTVLDREPRLPPMLKLDWSAGLLTFSPEQAELVAYNHHPAVAAPLNV